MGAAQPASPQPQMLDNPVLGRTNEAFPKVWLSLRVPSGEGGSQEAELKALTLAAAEAQTVLDLSVHPGLFGGYLRGHEGLLMGQGGLEIERAVDQKHAADLIQAHLIETLSAIGRDSLDLYFLKVRAPLEEFQAEGALEALEAARQEGHIRFLGIAAATNDPLAVLNLWQFHDAFEVLLLTQDRNLEGLRDLARERRVGIVTAAQTPNRSDVTLVPVSTPREVQAALDV